MKIMELLVLLGISIGTISCKKEVPNGDNKTDKIDASTNPGSESPQPSEASGGEKAAPSNEDQSSSSNTASTSLGDYLNQYGYLEVAAYLITDGTDLPACDASKDGKIYVINTPENIQLCTGGTWIALQLKGDKGDKGDPGPAGTSPSSGSSALESAINDSYSGNIEVRSEVGSAPGGGHFTISRYYEISTGKLVRTCNATVRSETITNGAISYIDSYGDLGCINYKYSAISCASGYIPSGNSCVAGTMSNPNSSSGSSSLSLYCSSNETKNTDGACVKNVYTEHVGNRICGTYPKDPRLFKAGTTYIVTCDTVFTGPVKIEAGVNILFDEYWELKYSGKVHADGSALAPVIFGVSPNATSTETFKKITFSPPEPLTTNSLMQYIGGGNLLRHVQFRSNALTTSTKTCSYDIASTRLENVELFRNKCVTTKTPIKDSLIYSSILTVDGEIDFYRTKIISSTIRTENMYLNDQNSILFSAVTQAPTRAGGGMTLVGKNLVAYSTTIGLTCTNGNTNEKSGVFGNVYSTINCPAASSTLVDNTTVSGSFTQKRMAYFFTSPAVPLNISVGKTPNFQVLYADKNGILSTAPILSWDVTYNFDGSTVNHQTNIETANLSFAYPDNYVMMLQSVDGLIDVMTNAASYNLRVDF